MTELFLALAFLLVGAVVIGWAFHARTVRGLGPGQTILLDNVTLYSEALGLVGKPDRVVSQGGTFIPEEWKPGARRLFESHRVQIGVYLLLVEEKFGTRPPYGAVVLAGGVRVEVPFTEELQAQVLSIVAQIREHRRTIDQQIPVCQPAAKCRACGQRAHCSQATL